MILFFAAGINRITVKEFEKLFMQLHVSNFLMEEREFGFLTSHK